MAAIAVLLVYEHSLVKPNDLARVNTAFFNVNAVVSMGLLVDWRGIAVVLMESNDDSICKIDRSTKFAPKSKPASGLIWTTALLLFSPEVHLNEVGELANLVRERKNGNFAYYNINTHLNPTNVCVYRCIFCAFRSDLREPKGYLMSDEQILARGQEAVDAGCTEMHIVGGLHHQMKFDWYLNLVRILHDHYPQLHLKAWTAVEINWFTHLTKRSVRRSAARN